MKKSLLVVFLASCVAMLVASSPVLAGDSWMGTWKLDAAASKFDPGPGPKSQTLTFEAYEGAVKLTSHTVEADGKETHGGYVSKFDGKDVAWDGNPDADMASPKRTGANSYENTWKKGGKATIVSKVVVSPDGKTLTIHQTGKDAEGKAAHNTIVFHRE